VLCMRREEEEQVQDGVGEAWVAAQAFGSWPQLDHGRCKLRGMLFDVLLVQSQGTRPISLSLIFFFFCSRFSSFYVLLSLVWNLGTWVGGWLGFQVWVSWKRGWGLKSA
jgi:hypothetical protein